MRVLLREVAGDRLVLALKGSSASVVDAILAGLSSRAAALVRDDLEALSGGRKADVLAARREIVTAALRLETDGQLDLGRGDDA